MKRQRALTLWMVGACGTALLLLSGGSPGVTGAEPQGSKAPSDAAIRRSRQTVEMLDNVFKQTVVLVTDKYVHDEDDFAAGSAVVLLFKNLSESGPNTVRLIDATGEPYDPENVARDAFERKGLQRLKAGDSTYDEVEYKDGMPYLRAVTAVPVVMQKCVMCHAHYANVKKGEPIGAISYTVPIETSGE